MSRQLLGGRPTVLLRYRAATLRLAGTSESAVLSLWSRYQAGQLDEAQFRTLAAAVIAAHNARAVTLADLALAAVLAVELARLVVPLGLLATDDRPRLREALGTLLARAAALELPGADAVERSDAELAMMARIARSEPLAAGQGTFQRGMQRRRVPGWTRGTGPAPCPVCAGLADGTVLAPSTVMYTHRGCSCVMIPTERTPG